MPSRFRSGEETTQFDQMTTGQAREELHRMSLKLAKMYEASVLDEMFAKRDKSIHDIMEVQAFHRERISNLAYSQKEIYDKMQIFLNSKLMRFLNFFGCWYIYGKNGCVYINRPYNEKYGPAPVLTRIKRRFKKTFIKTPSENETKDGYKTQFIFVDESVPNTEEKTESEISDLSGN